MATMNDVAPAGASEVTGRPGAFNNLLFVVENDRRCSHCLQRAIDMAVQFHAALSLVYVVPRIPPLPPDPAYVFLGPKEHQRRTQAWAERTLGRLAKRLSRRNVKARAIVRCGDAVDEIIRLATAEGADAIVVCEGRMTHRPYRLFASVVDRVTRLTGCPLLVLPAANERRVVRTPS